MFLNQTIPPPFLKGWSVIFFGGNVNFGNREDDSFSEKPFGNLQIMAESDLRIVNFEYCRTHPEQINLLTAAKIDVALTADNQSNNYLDRAGILNAAARPLFVKVNKIVVALLSVNANSSELWKDKIADAQKKADVVLVALNCDIEQLKTLGKALIDNGADGVLGCNSIQGVETYKQRPIIYGAGNLLSDSKAEPSGGFSLITSKRGVQEIYFMPLTIDNYKTSLADAAQAKKICAEFSDSCRKLNSKVITLASDLLKLKFEPSRQERKLETVELSKPKRNGEKISKLQLSDLPKFADSRTEENISKLQLSDLPNLTNEPAQENMNQQFSDLPKFADSRTEENISKLQLSDLPNLTDAPAKENLNLQLSNFPNPDNEPAQENLPKLSDMPNFTDEPTQENIPNLRLSDIPNLADAPTQENFQLSGLTKFTDDTTAEENLAKLQIQDLPNIVDAPAQENIIDKFKREFKAKNGVMFFMLRNIKAKAAGLEHAAFRRAKLFRKHFGIEINLVTHEFQNDTLEQRDAYGLDVRVLNMYDYFQEINRDIEKPRRVFIAPMQDGWAIERVNRDFRVYRQNGKLAMYCVFALKDQKLSYINFFNDDGKKCRRDMYDMLGFLSCRQELEIKTERPTEIFYYRPDGTVAIHEVYQVVKEKNTLTSMELINRDGEVTKTFKNHEEAMSYFLLQNLKDTTKNYFLIGDRTPEWHKSYAGIKSAKLDNVRVIHQLHNIHVRAPFDPFTSELRARNRYFYDKKYKVDAIITLTKQQQLDIAKRYKLDNVVVIPHSLNAVPRVTDVELNPFKIVQVGRIVEEKGQAKAVEVMKRVLEKVPQATLHFYGTGSLQSKIQKLIDANNLSEQIKFEGFSDNMPAVFASSALSILPSTFEGFAMVIQESLQQNCPVVAFDCNYGPSDMIADGVNGYLVPVGDVDAMADRIIKILSEPKLREKLAANCAQSIEKFSPEIIAGKWAELFHTLLKGE